MKTRHATRKLSFDTARQALLERRDQLIERHRATSAEEDELLSHREHDLPDVAAERSAAAVLERLDDADHVRLLRISRALQRIDDGTYGFCVVCGGPIAAARLQLVPEADRCAGCHNSH
jgi:RNA polymerase-binding transcription factor DksA